MRRKLLDFLPGVATPEVPRFSTSEVARILGIPIWRLEKFLGRYELSPARQLGKGRGSRRLFSSEDVYRIGLAGFLIRDGFAPKFIAGALQFVEDRDLIDWDERGHPQYLGILFRRGKDKPRLGFFPSGKPPEIKAGDPVYYILDLGDVIREIDRRIAALTSKR